MFRKCRVRKRLFSRTYLLKIGDSVLFFCGFTEAGVHGTSFSRYIFPKSYRSCIQSRGFVFLSLWQNIPHCLDSYVSIISPVSGHVSTWNRAKPESEIPSVAVTVFIAWKANACSEWDEEPRALNPFLLHSVCKDAWEPINDFHFIRPAERARKYPWAINE